MNVNGLRVCFPCVCELQRVCMCEWKLLIKAYRGAIVIHTNSSLRFALFFFFLYYIYKDKLCKKKNIKNNNNNKENKNEMQITRIWLFIPYVQML